MLISFKGRRQQKNNYLEIRGQSRTAVKCVRKQLLLLLVGCPVNDGEKILQNGNENIVYVTSIKKKNT